MLAVDGLRLPKYLLTQETKQAYTIGGEMVDGFRKSPWTGRRITHPHVRLPFEHYKLERPRIKRRYRTRQLRLI